MTWVFLTDKKRNEISYKSGPYVADSFAPHEAEVRRLNPRDNWVGLTDEERDPIRSKFVGKLHYVADVLAEFEAKLKWVNSLHELERICGKQWFNGNTVYDGLRGHLSPLYKITNYTQVDH